MHLMQQLPSFLPFEGAVAGFLLSPAAWLSCKFSLRGGKEEELSLPFDPLLLTFDPLAETVI